ncbi:MAG: hypothetical protein ACJAW4_001814 [Paracoccaceae bacterium]|jgi:hypothetical protein
MSGDETWPRRRLGPMRDLHVSDLLERMARGLDSGADVTAEPLARTQDGAMARTRRLHLPFRRDLAITSQARVLHPRIDTPLDPTAAPGITALCTGAFSLNVTPFQWQAAELRLMGGDMDAFVWAPLRLWFLEWTQPRRGDESPDLLGVVHSLSDPETIPGGARLRIDFGSSPVDCVGELLDALSRTGADSGALGLAPEAA